jgi:tetraprenyl-beta-curcumene synthase
MSSAQSIELFGPAASDLRASPAPAPAHRIPLARTWLALLLANTRYWGTVFPVVRAEIRRWQAASRTIQDPRLRELASGKLREERFNIELAATFATVAPPAERRLAVEAIVAVQILYDYLDSLWEQQLLDGATEERLVDTMRIEDAPSAWAPVEAVHSARARIELAHSACARGGIRASSRGDSTYLQALTAAAKGAFARLPGARVVESQAQGAAERCRSAQRLAHGAHHGAEQALHRWASDAVARSASQHGLACREWLAGAQASVLCQHALIAAAADTRTTTQEAILLDELYLSIGALTMLDSVVDQAQDTATGHPSHLRFYESPSRMAWSLTRVAKAAIQQAMPLRRASWHAMLLTGVVAYYSSAPVAGSAWREATAGVSAELRPAIAPTLALMRCWRFAKRLRERMDREHVRRN